MTNITIRHGGSWLLEETPSSEVFTPEKMSDEHRMMAQTADEFIEKEVLPNLDRLEQKDWDLARSLVRRCGELGLLGTNVPEQFGGLAGHTLDPDDIAEAAWRMFVKRDRAEEVFNVL